MHKSIALVLIVLLGTGSNVFAQTNSTPTAGIVAATKKFLATLDDAQPTQETLNRLLKPFRLKLSLAPIEQPKSRHAA